MTSTGEEVAKSGPSCIAGVHTKEKTLLQLAKVFLKWLDRDLRHDTNATLTLAAKRNENTARV